MVPLEATLVVVSVVEDIVMCVGIWTTGSILLLQLARLYTACRLSLPRLSILTSAPSKYNRSLSLWGTERAGGEATGVSGCIISLLSGETELPSYQDAASYFVGLAVIN